VAVADTPAARSRQAAGRRPPAAASRHRRGARPAPGTAGPDPGAGGARAGPDPGRL